MQATLSSPSASRARITPLNRSLETVTFPVGPIGIVEPFGAIQRCRNVDAMRIEEREKVVRNVVKRRCNYIAYLPFFFRVPLRDLFNCPLDDSGGKQTVLLLGTQPLAQETAIQKACR